MEQAPVKVAVFDLNQTVYLKSSKEEFFKFVCYKRNYKLLNVFQIALFQLIGKMRLMSKTEFKENFFSYLNGLPPATVKEYARQFWQIEWKENFNPELLRRIEELRKEEVQIIFITGGFDVYVAPFFEDCLRVDAWMATQTEYDGHGYKIKGKALKDEEKVKRLEEHFLGKPYELIEAYSDEKEAILDKAEQGYFIKNGEVIPYRKQ